MNKKKHIVFFNGFYLPHLGGVERYTSNLVNKLKKYYNITIVTTGKSSEKSFEIIDGINIYRLPCYKTFSERYPIIKHNRNFKDTLKKIQDMHIDHIICNTRYYQTTQIGVKIAKKNKIDLSIIDHSSSHISLSNKFIDFFARTYEDHLTRKILKSNPRFYGVSKRVNEWLEFYGIKASGVFYNSIDECKFNKRKLGKQIKIAYVGRVIKEKGVENLTKAYYRLKDKYDITLTIAGDGNYLEFLKKNYPDVSYLGAINHNDVVKLMQDTDIFVHPSMYPEGLPTVILEAGMMKCAVLATDRGGTKEVITSDKEGIIIKENSKDLENKLSKLLDDTKIIVNLQKGIYDKVCRDFTWENTAKGVWEELKKYEE